MSLAASSNAEKWQFIIFSLAEFTVSSPVQCALSMNARHRAGVIAAESGMESFMGFALPVNSDGIFFEKSIKSCVLLSGTPEPMIL
ncbi:MAG: hypothetical protein WCY41_01985 [Candidatus Micrarchaeia archaeon]